MTLIVISVSAKESIDFTKINGFAYGKSLNLGAWELKGVRLSTGEFIINKEAKTADDSQVKYFNASAYDCVVL